MRDPTTLREACKLRLTVHGNTSYLQIFSSFGIILQRVRLHFGTTWGWQQVSRTLRVTTVTLSIGSRALTLWEEAKTATVSLRSQH